MEISNAAYTVDSMCGFSPMVRSGCVARNLKFDTETLLLLFLQLTSLTAYANIYDIYYSRGDVFAQWMMTATATVT
ncbi:MAG: hypothetical protein RR859_08290, partial [Ruthenibacterium sp.]